jgi:hypothetical protein
MKNRHPVDQLGDVRSEIEKLRNREKKLRRQILDEELRDGDQYCVHVHEKTRRSLTITRLEVLLGKAWVNRNADYIHSTNVTVKEQRYD